MRNTGYLRRLSVIDWSCLSSDPSTDIRRKHDEEKVTIFNLRVGYRQCQIQILELFRETRSEISDRWAPEEKGSVIYSVSSRGRLLDLSLTTGSQLWDPLFFYLFLCLDGARVEGQVQIPTDPQHSTVILSPQLIKRHHWQLKEGITGLLHLEDRLGWVSKVARDGTHNFNLGNCELMDLQLLVRIPIYTTLSLPHTTVATIQKETY